MMLTKRDTDSTAGKFMEKAGNMFKSEGMAEKGREKREQAGLGGDNYGSTGGSGSNY